MKKYAKLVLASVFIFSMSAMAQEQTPTTGTPGVQKEQKQGQKQMATAQMRAENMAKELKLTDAEKAKVQEVFEKNDVLFTKFRAEVKRDNPDFKEKFKALRDAQDADLEQAIGKDKLETWKKIQAERRQKMNNN